jgi:hypothetical protein
VNTLVGQDVVPRRRFNMDGVVEVALPGHDDDLPRPPAKTVEFTAYTVGAFLNRERERFDCG